jgi:arylsulfatase A-like enzyme
LTDRLRPGTLELSADTYQQIIEDRQGQSLVAADPLLLMNMKGSKMSLQRPHIVIFNPDQWRGDVLGHVGNPSAVTPVLDDLVEQEAVSFSSAYCQNPVCTPSRCSFLTGWYPHVRGHRTMYHMLQPDEPMLLRTLKEEGYFVWWGGKNDVVPAQNGFEAYCNEKYGPDWFSHGYGRAQTNWRGEPESDTYYSFYVGKVEQSVDYDLLCVQEAIKTIKNAPGDQPLCIYLPLLNPHPPYRVSDPWFSMIDREKLPPRIPAPEDWQSFPSMLKGLFERFHMQSWSEERWNELRATYYGMCAYTDHLFGMVLEALREAGIYDDTAIFFFSDHGDFTGDYGLVEKTQNTFEDCLTRVPFIIKPPAGTPIVPRVCDELVELIDMPATVEALTGIKVQHTHFGRSLLPLLADPQSQGRDAVFCEGGRRHGETQAMEDSPAGAPGGLYWPRASLQHSEGPEHTKATMCRTKSWKYVHRLYESDELYDLRSDPQELHNLVTDPTLTPILNELKDRLLRFYLETSDVVPMKTDKRETFM